MYLISTSMGNDSIALIQLAHEMDLADCHVVYIDTGWSHPDWAIRVAQGVALSEKYGFTPHTIEAELKFEDLITIKKGFPGQKYQWCSAALKGLPFSKFASEIDPSNAATVVIGKRREESQSRANTPEFIWSSKYHEGRKVWHPLFKHTEAERNELIVRAGFKPLPHRSMECCPCVNANRDDLRNTPESQINKVRDLEELVGNTMFRPYRHMGAKGIDEVMKWAKSDRGKYIKSPHLCPTGMCG